MILRAYFRFNLSCNRFWLRFYKNLQQQLELVLIPTTELSIKLGEKLASGEMTVFQVFDIIHSKGMVGLIDYLN